MCGASSRSRLAVAPACSMSGCCQSGSPFRVHSLHEHSLHAQHSRLWAWHLAQAGMESRRASSGPAVHTRHHGCSVCCELPKAAACYPASARGWPQWGLTAVSGRGAPSRWATASANFVRIVPPGAQRPQAASHGQEGLVILQRSVEPCLSGPGIGGHEAQGHGLLSQRACSSQGAWLGADPGRPPG